jgi:hypothetical protein
VAGGRAVVLAGGRGAGAVVYRLDAGGLIAVGEAAARLDDDDRLLTACRGGSWTTTNTTSGEQTDDAGQPASGSGGDTPMSLDHVTLPHRLPQTRRRAEAVVNTCRTR